MECKANITEGCNKKGTYECEECGIVYCAECAEAMEYECDCIPMPEIRKIVNKIVVKKKK